MESNKYKTIDYLYIFIAVMRNIDFTKREQKSTKIALEMHHRIEKYRCKK